MENSKLNNRLDRLGSELLKKNTLVDAINTGLPERVKVLEKNGVNFTSPIFASHDVSSSLEDIGQQCDTLEGKILAMST